MFPTLDMLKEGYQIYVAADACGDVSKEAHERALSTTGASRRRTRNFFAGLFRASAGLGRGETYDGRHGYITHIRPTVFRSVFQSGR